MTRLIAVLLARPRIRIVTQTRDYIHAECARKFFDLVDDLEFYMPEEGNLIHVRSASRVGYSDWGVNEARVNELRQAFDEAD